MTCMRTHNVMHPKQQNKSIGTCVRMAARTDGSSGRKQSTVIVNTVCWLQPLSVTKNGDGWQLYIHSRACAEFFQAELQGRKPAELRLMDLLDGACCEGW